MLGDFKHFGKQIRISRDVIELKGCLTSSWSGGVHQGYALETKKKIAAIFEYPHLDKSVD